ncbi:GLPGLI family protein [Marinifilum sp.]|uniref:GLPGLI family protein n=1 Tax=Marinifilum sp. TaxID=2033137 RepID=UPI003BA97196
MKKKIVFIAILTLTTISLFAQEKELYIKYKYSIEYSECLLFSEMPEMINGKIELFSYGNKMISRKYDGVSNTLDEDGNLIASDSVYYYTVIDYPKGYLLISEDVSVSTAQFLLKEPLNLFKWKPCMDTKTILGYTCHKATCNFRGREYVAWFTREIPFKAAPWKFHGLPGVLLEVYSTDGYCSWVAESLEIRPFKKEIELPFYGWDIVDLKKYIKVLKAKKQSCIEWYKRNGESEEFISNSVRTIEKFDLD